MSSLKTTISNCLRWINDYILNGSGDAQGVVLGISGGKDSTICAKLCVEALGKDNVMGVIIPNGFQDDLGDAVDVCCELGIEYRIVNIKDAYNELINAIRHSKNSIDSKEVWSSYNVLNIAPRLRTNVLYSIAQGLNYRVCGTSNLSEAILGYCTLHADCNAWDFNPIGNFTKGEVVQIGKLLGLPKHLVDKTPADGLTGKSDEENFGFTYEELDAYLLGHNTSPCSEDKIKSIESKIEKSKFKRYYVNNKNVFNPNKAMPYKYE